MSMLAERRRKSKYVLNPTKKPLWTTDSSGIKFGKELMEKMGWSAGKGLGANEQGIQEPLRVSYKNDSKGMGYKGNEENWIEYQDEFNSLLNQLASNTENNVKTKEAEKSEVMSLEEKSKLSKARVHYQKFTRGKDISKYSENDLSCILGTGKIKKGNNEIAVEKETHPENSIEETSFGVTTINSGSIKDYFKKKWTLNNLKSESSNAKQSQNVFDEEQQLNEETDTHLGKKSKKRQRENKEEFLKDEKEVEGNENVEKELKKHKKKKKKLDFEEEILSKEERKTEINIKVQENEKNQLEIDNSPEDITMDCAQDVFKSKKKKKKERECEELESIDELKSQSEVPTCEKRNKKRKKEKESELKSVENDSYEVERNIMEEEPQNETQQEYFTKKKKKKEKKAMESLEIDSNCELGVNGNAMIQELTRDTEVAGNEETRKKKKKNKKDTEIQDNNPNYCGDLVKNLKSELEDAGEEQPVKKKKKKKKKKKEKESENLPAEEQTNGDEDAVKEFQNEGDIVKKEKKKKKKCLEESEKKNEEEQMDNEFLGVTAAVEVALIEKEKKGKMKENTEIQSQPEEARRKSKKNKKEKKEKECESKDYEPKANTLDSQDIVSKKKDEIESGSCPESVTASEALKGTEKKRSNNKEEKENKNGEVESGGEGEKTLVHTHKTALFQMKKPFVDNLKSCSPAKALKLICGADIGKFKGANLGNLPGYGCKRSDEKNMGR